MKSHRHSEHGFLYYTRTGAENRKILKKITRHEYWSKCNVLFLHKRCHSLFFGYNIEIQALNYISHASCIFSVQCSDFVFFRCRGGALPPSGVGGSLGSNSTQQLTPSDDSDIYSHIDNDDDEQQLVKPSQLKKQRRFQQGKKPLLY